jgi:hypothetical protein
MVRGNAVIGNAPLPRLVALEAAALRGGRVWLEPSTGRPMKYAWALERTAIHDPTGCQLIETWTGAGYARSYLPVSDDPALFAAAVAVLDGRAPKRRGRPVESGRARDFFRRLVVYIEAHGQAPSTDEALELCGYSDERALRRAVHPYTWKQLREMAERFVELGLILGDDKSVI